MLMLAIGVLIFFGVHCLRLLAPAWREGKIAQWGAQKWKLFYSVLSAVGLVLMVLGYGSAHTSADMAGAWWAAPAWGRALNAVVMLFVFILLAASHSPFSHIKKWLRHPMSWATLLFALAHLLINSSSADLLLFGSFAVWGLWVLLAAYARDARDAQQGSSLVAPRWSKTLINVAIGTLLWLVFAKWLHPLLIGVVVLPQH